MLNNKNYLQSSLEISLYFLPISFLLGTLIVNLNLIIFIFLSTIYLIIKKIKVNFNLSNLILLAFFLTLIFSSYKNIEQIGIENFLKSIFLLKFYMLYIYVEALLFERKINTKYFFTICLIASVWGILRGDFLGDNLFLVKDKESIDDYEFEDFEIVNYQFHPHIPAKVAI